MGYLDKLTNLGTYILLNNIIGSNDFQVGQFQVLGQLILNFEERNQT
jgi:hypothetical protein